MQGVSTSPAGNDVIMGSAYQEAAYLFTRSGSTWNQQSRLIASHAGADNEFGYGVALSADGSVAAVGNAHEGAAYVFTRSGSTWSHHEVITAGEGAASVPSLWQASHQPQSNLTRGMELKAP